MSDLWIFMITASAEECLHGMFIPVGDGNVNEEKQLV